MTPKRYLEFFDEVCKDEGVYELSIGWKKGVVTLQYYSGSKTDH